jgi:hypothetical protein
MKLKCEDTTLCIAEQHIAVIVTYSAFFTETMLTKLYVIIGILLTYGKHLHDNNTSIRGEVWDHKIGLAPPLSTQIARAKRAYLLVSILSLFLHFVPVSTILSLFL